MSFVWMSPDAVTAAAGDLAAIHSTLDDANAAAALPTSGALAPAADGVSALVGAVFGSHAQEYQGLSAQMGAFHEEIIRQLNSSVAAYLGAEIANAQQAAVNAVNAPAQALLGHPLIGNGGSSGAAAPPGGAAPGPGVGGPLAAGGGAMATPAVGTPVSAAPVAGAAAGAAARGAAGTEGAATLLSARAAAGVQAATESIAGAPAGLGSLLASAAPAAPAAAASTAAFGDAYQELFANTATNLQLIGQTVAADPAPLLSQIIANQQGYANTIGSSLTSGDLSPIFAIPGQIQQNLINIGNTLTNTTLNIFIQTPPIVPVPAVDIMLPPAATVIIAAAGPPVATLSAFGTSATAFAGAAQTGDVVGALGALIDAPAVVGNGFLNGQVTVPLSLPSGLGSVVIQVPFDGILVPQHSVAATWVPTMGAPVDFIAGGTLLGGIVPTLLSFEQQLALAITPT